jgi:predicted NUDIX family phosphoesterase
VTEQVLVVPTEVLRAAGLFHGFTDRVERYLPHLLDPAHLRFLPRDLAEHDPSYKQLIPYLVLRHQGAVFHYRRGKGGGEKRLAARRSIGIGGHVNHDDGDLAGAYQRGLHRELAEEVALAGGYAERCVGLINDDRTPVGQVHLGIVHLLDLETAQVRCREEALIDGAFSDPAVLRQDALAFETWSQFLLQGEWLDSA